MMRRDRHQGRFTTPSVGRKASDCHPSLDKEGSERAFSPPCLRRGGTRFLRDGVVKTLVMTIIAVIVGSSAYAQTTIKEDSPQLRSLSDLLQTGNSEQKRTALAEIRNLRTEKASRLAIPALTDSDEIVRATAAASVIFLPESEAAQVLLPLLDDKKPFVRREAAYALGQVGNWSATRKLTGVLEKDRDVEVRSAAAVALGNIGDYSAVESLVRVLNKKPTEDDEFLRRSSARAIGQVFDLYTGGNTYTITPQNFLPPKFKDVGARKDLTQLQSSVDLIAVVRTLSQVLQNSKEADDTRREAAFALGAIRQGSTAAILRSFLNSPDPYLAEISKEALVKIENQE